MKSAEGRQAVCGGVSVNVHVYRQKGKNDLCSYQRVDIRSSFEIALDWARDTASVGEVASAPSDRTQHPTVGGDTQRYQRQAIAWRSDFGYIHRDTHSAHTCAVSALIILKVNSLKVNRKI